MIVEPSEADVGARRDRDRALVEAHCNGDPDAFATIVGDHYRVLLAQAERRVRSRAEAEDLVQDAFERAFRAMCRFGVDGEYRLGAWLSRILANVCCDREGRLARERVLPELLAVHELDGTEAFDTVSDPLVLQAVHDAIDALPSSQRDTFLLRECDGLTYPQVADRLEISEENAHARVHRAKAALRRSLALTRGMLPGIVAIPVGFRSLFRRVRGYPPMVPTGAEAGSTGAQPSIAVQLATNPVAQAVATVAPSGAVRGSAIMAIAGLTVTGAIGLPMVTDLSSSAPPVAAVAAPPPPTPDPIPWSSPTLDESIDTTATTTTPPATPDTTTAGDRDGKDAAIVAKARASSWWEGFTLAFALDGPTDDQGEGTTPVVGPAPVGIDTPLGCTPPSTDGPGVTATAVTPVVSQIDLAPVATTGAFDDELQLTTTARLTGGGQDGEPLVVKSTACSSPFPGAIEITLSHGGKVVRLFGGIVYNDSGTRVYRGTATSSADSMPWGTRATFMARLIVTPDEPSMAQLAIVFFEDADGVSAPQGTPKDIVVPPPAKEPGDESDPTAPTTTTTPASPQDPGDSNKGSPSAPTTTLPQEPALTGATATN